MNDRSVSIPALQAKGLCKTYPNGTRALIDVDLEIDGSALVVILGPSGAGKSTFLRCINRLVTPTGGELCLHGENLVHVGGRDLRRIRARVGMIFQQFNLVKRLSVLENVLAGRLAHRHGLLQRGLSLTRIFPRDERDLAFECLRKVHIEHLALQRADTLSGGQQQRVAIARTLAQEPELILADEPVASLDPASAEVVMNNLEEIHQTQGIPVMVNLHQIDLGKKYGRRIIGMNSGRICFDGPPEDLNDLQLQTIYGHELDSGLGRATPRKQDRDEDQEPARLEPALAAAD